MKPVRKAIFPVGGLGTRFLPATKALPKEMLPIVDRPLIEYAVDEAKAAGIEEFIFVTGRGKAAIEDHFDRNLDLVAAEGPIAPGGPRAPMQSEALSSSSGRRPHGAAGPERTNA